MNIQIKERKSKFIHQFEHQAKGIICPTFYVFGWAHRCLFEPKCSYCFLNLTFRHEKEPKIYTSDTVMNEVSDWLKKTVHPSVLNAGELSDSFMSYNNQLLADMMNLFEEQEKHKLLFLTKHNIIPVEIENNIYTRQYKQTIFSFSVNSQEVALRYEKGAPLPFDRMATAYRVKKHGQRVRIRIDPIIEINDFKLEYANVINVINDFLQPERVTLGSLRFFKNLQNFSNDTEVFKYCIDNNDSDHRMRLPFAKRLEIYRWFIDNLKISEIGLCKETLACHRKLKFRKDLKCNCTI